ncbi:uncharacterized protein METZ01_LOCUS362270, partial [marine metagenome]
MIGLIKRIFGTKNEREVGKIRSSLVPVVDAFSEKIKALSDDELCAKTKAWQEELKPIEDDEQLAYRLEEIKPEAFAVVKEVARRLCGITITVRGQEILWDMV